MPSAATWVDTEMTTLSEVSQSEKDKYHAISHICGIYNTSEHINKTKPKSETQRTEVWLPREGEDGEGTEGEV